MCDYGGFEGDISEDILVRQAADLLDQWGEGETEINLSCLGSFFDDREVSPKARREILGEIAKREHIQLLGVESRANDVSEAKVREALSILGIGCCLEVGMGLESVNDFVRNVCVNKGLPLRRFERAVETIGKCGAHAVGHVLFKPPFLTEAETISDAIATITYLDSLQVRRIVLMVANVKHGTLLGELYDHDFYRPPWLWSVLKTAMDIPRSARDRLLIYGFRCGLPMTATGHNCPKCSQTIIELLEQFSGTGNHEHLYTASHIDCPCKTQWRVELDTDDLPPLPTRILTSLDCIEAGYERLSLRISDDLSAQMDAR